METILTVVHLFLAIGLVGLVLMQHGKGADAGAAFGSGASATVFGSQGSANFLSRTTGIFAALFFMTSLSLAYFAMKTTKTEGLMDSVSVSTPASAPVVDVNKSSDLPTIPGVAETLNESDVPAVKSSAPVVPMVEANKKESDLPAVTTE